MAPITHICLFKFLETTSKADILAACQRFSDLQEKCVHPQSQKPYLKNFSGGVNNSNEPLDQGYQYGFVSYFETEADRDYYTKEDPDHLAFVASLKGLIAPPLVLDFENGVY